MFGTSENNKKRFGEFLFTFQYNMGWALNFYLEKVLAKDIQLHLQRYTGWTSQYATGFLLVGVAVLY